MACVTCHDQNAGWTGPDSAINLAGSIYPGAVAARFGNRKPNSAAYATFAPTLYAKMEEGEILFVEEISGTAGPPGIFWAIQRPIRPSSRF